ncbi:MAG: hypothetical protein R6V85_10555 [Polyangia bacterium]
MTARNGPKRSRKGLAALLTAGGVVLAVFALLFFVVNDRWVLISCPAVPWDSAATAADYEVHFAALVLLGFSGGALLAVVLMLRVLLHARRRIGEERRRVAWLERELDNVSRLLARSRDSR